MTLIGLGYRSISMSPASIGPVKAMLTELPLAKLEVFLADMLARPGVGRNTRHDLTAFAHEHDIPL
jgi:phosphotransferase system enzyme I (PtsP)